MSRASIAVISRRRCRSTTSPRPSSRSSAVRQAPRPDSDDIFTRRRIARTPSRARLDRATMILVRLADSSRARLVEVDRLAGADATMVDGESEVDETLLEGTTVGLTAGASTPGVSCRRRSSGSTRTATTPPRGDGRPRGRPFPAAARGAARTSVESPFRSQRRCRRLVARTSRRGRAPSGRGDGVRDRDISRRRARIVRVAGARTGYARPRDLLQRLVPMESRARAARVAAAGSERQITSPNGVSPRPLQRIMLVRLAPGRGRGTCRCSGEARFRKRIKRHFDRVRSGAPVQGRRHRYIAGVERARRHHRLLSGAASAARLVAELAAEDDAPARLRASRHVAGKRAPYYRRSSPVVKVAIALSSPSRVAAREGALHQRSARRGSSPPARGRPADRGSHEARDAPGR